MSSTLEIAKWSFVVLYVLATIGVVVGVYWENDKFPKETQDKGWKLLVRALAAEILFGTSIFVVDGIISERQSEKIIALEENTSARPWTKDQFDAIQGLKGTAVKDVAVLSETHCVECSLLAEHIERALHEAGVTLYRDFPPSNRLGDFTGTGIDVWVPSGFNLTENPLVAALTKADLLPSAGRIDAVPAWPFKPNVWVIIVGERFPRFLRFPFEPSGGAQWQYSTLSK